MWHFPCFPICFPFRSHFLLSPSPLKHPISSTWGHLGRPFEGHLNALGCEAWQASGEVPLSNGKNPFFGDSGWGHLWTNPPRFWIYFDMEVENDVSEPKIGIWWFGEFFSFQVKQQLVELQSIPKLFEKLFWSLWIVSSSMTFQSQSLLFPSWSDSGRDTNSTTSIFRLEALAYIDHGSSLNHLSVMLFCLMPQADPWRSLDRARDKKRSVAHEMEHHIRLLVGHIVGIGQPGNEITTSGQDVLKKCRLPKKTGSYKCF